MKRSSFLAGGRRFLFTRPTGKFNPFHAGFGCTPIVRGPFLKRQVPLTQINASCRTPRSLHTAE